jgi:cytochrome c
MARIRFAALFVLAVLAAGCSRTSPDAPKQLSEQQALDLLVKQLKAHRVADLECLSFMDESDHPSNGKAAQWDFAAHEIHNARCGGDPGVSPVRDRYRIDAAGKVLVYNAAETDYAPL